MSVQNIASWEIMENLETEFLHLYNLDIGQKWFCRSLDQLKTCPQITGYLCEGEGPEIPSYCILYSESNSR